VAEKQGDVALTTETEKDDDSEAWSRAVEAAAEAVDDLDQIEQIGALWCLLSRKYVEAYALNGTPLKKAMGYLKEDVARLDADIRLEYPKALEWYADNKAETQTISFPLLNAEAQNAKHPDTCWIPPKDVRNNLRAGDLAKVSFQLTGKEVAAERIWILVTGRMGDSYIGTINNYPVFLEAEAGDVVTFKAENVIDAKRPKAN
jgi:hypothetical protein